MSTTLEKTGHRFGPNSRVAVVGAGISGVTAAGHLLKQGLSVTVFERSDIAGGVWHFNEKTPADPTYPSNIPSVGDYNLSTPGQYAYRTPPPDSPGGQKETLQQDKEDDALQTRFSPPGPCYAGLKNNVPTPLMTSVLGSWPEGTEDQVNQNILETYIQTIARDNGVEQVTRYNTRVDEIKKTNDGQRWSIRTVTLERPQSVPQLVERYDEVDAVVVASGHYNLPRIPDTPGLKEWKAVFGERVIHSKQYRKAERYRGKNLLVIGAGVSSTDICRELGEVADKLYQSVRGGLFDLPSSMLPGIAERVGEVGKYEINQAVNAGSLSSDEHIPGTVTLKDGRILTDIDYVIVATGYITSYPFLQHLHDDTIKASDAGPEVLVTSEGEMAHNLHKDIFYIPDPTLAFVGVPYHVATFSLFDFQSQIVTRVFAGKALLPTEEGMRDEYRKRIEEKGAGRTFHSLRGENGEVRYVQALVDWANQGAEAFGAEKMKGHTDSWLEKYAVMRERLREVLGLGTH